MSALTDRKAALQRLLVDPPAGYTGAIDSDLGPQTRAAFDRLAAAEVDTIQAYSPVGKNPTPVCPNGCQSGINMIDGAYVDCANCGAPPKLVTPPADSGLITDPLITDHLQPNAWPLEADAAAFFGDRPNLTSIVPPYPLRMFDGKVWEPIHSFSCHPLVAPSLRRILAAILAHYGDLAAIQAVGLDVFDGCYADRNVRGSATKRSMHSYGAAIDFDAEHNPLGATTGRMPEAAVAIFTAESWRWGGHYQGRKDWMHFEACR